MLTPFDCVTVYVPAGVVKLTLLEPPVYVRASVNDTGVPQANGDAVPNWNGVAFVDGTPGRRFGYVESGCVIETPGVVVYRMALTVASVFPPMFSTTRLRKLHSLGSMDPLPLPPLTMVAVIMTSGRVKK